MPTPALYTSMSSTEEDPETDMPNGDRERGRGTGSSPEDGAEKTADERSVDADDSPPNARLPRWRRSRMTLPRWATLVGMTVAAGLAALIGVLAVQTYHAHQSAQLRASYLQVGRQVAVNLTTIDWHHVDTDVERILSSATGTFYDDFSQRAQPFKDVVKKVQSVSTGTVTIAGLESSTDAEARVLVAVSVQTTTSAAPQQTPRAWRMRLTVQKAGNDVKVSNVEFVP